MLADIPDWVTAKAAECYKALAAAQLPIDDDNVTKWLAIHAPVFTWTDEDDLDDKIEGFIEEVKKQERAAAAIVEAGAGGGE